MGRSSISVRGLAAIAAACALLCLAAASASAAPLAVVASRDSNEIALLNTATNHLVKQIEVGEGPASVAVTPDGRYAYVADAFGKSVSVVDTSMMKTVGEPIEVGTTPFGVAITPDGRRAFVTDRGSGEVSVIDTATRKSVEEIPVGTGIGSGPTGVAVSPDGTFAYVTLSADDAVEVIDTDTLKVVGEPIEVGDGPAGVEFSPDGRNAYVVDQLGDAVSAIDTATGEVTTIPLEGGDEPRGIVVAPDGRHAFVVDLASKSVSVIDTATARVSGEIEVGAEPSEVALTANGKTLYVAEAGGTPGERTTEVQRIDVETGTIVGTTIVLPGEFASGIAIAPDQSPTAAFTAPTNVTAGTPVTFSGAASTDPDGSVASWSWAFGDGGAATGVTATHTYKAAATYGAKLSVVDDEGCGEELVSTGRTAYCSGNVGASVTHAVTAKAPPVTQPEPIAGPAAPPSNNFRIGRIVHNRRNGTVRLQVKLPSAGYIFLFGKKVHAVTRKSKGPQSMWLTLHARVELAKRLKKTLRAPVRFRITFTPNGGTAKTVHRSVTLQRAPRHASRRH
jgi:YVTN family beta-propeller protein